jgi:hypothetical protein
MECFDSTRRTKEDTAMLIGRMSLASCIRHLNVHGTRITAHKVNLNARVAPLARATQLMTCELKIGLKRTIGPRESLFSSNGHTTMHHTHFCTQIERRWARQLQCNFCNFEV